MDEVKVTGIMVHTVEEAMNIWKKHFVYDSFFLDDGIVMFVIN